MSDVKSAISRGDKLFKGRGSLLELWQDIARNFYPQRADFTTSRYLGEDFAANLYSSYPMLVHRELSTSFAAMLRPRAKEWFEISVHDDDRIGPEAKQWLEFASKRQRRLMYDSHTQFIRATTEGDADFAAFGQAVISREINWNAQVPHLLYRCWHLRDVAWQEDFTGKLSEIHVNWNPTVAILKGMFGEDVHKTLKEKREGSGERVIKCRRTVMKAEEWGEKQKMPWVVLYIDCENNHLMREEYVWSHGFTIPRWQTVSGSQYAFSPATVAGLPDARLLQAMSLTLLEAGEFAVRPPVIATQEAIRSDINWFPGGITYADTEYDERKGDVLRPISQDKSGIPFGIEFAQDQKEMLAAAFYINKLTLPPPTAEMTAYEVGQRVEEYIRSALPLFEPMETQYNGGLCEDTFDVLLKAGAFGPPQDIPQELQGQEVEFKFISPLHDAIERKQASTFLESSQLIAQAMQLDPSTAVTMDIHKALRDALDGIGAEADWVRSMEEVQQIVAEQQQMAEAKEAMAMAEQAGAAAKEMRDATQEQR